MCEWDVLATPSANSTNSSCTATRCCAKPRGPRGGESHKMEWKRSSTAFMWTRKNLLVARRRSSSETQLTVSKTDVCCQSPQISFGNTSVLYLCGILKWFMCWALWFFCLRSCLPWRRCDGPGCTSWLRCCRRCSEVGYRDRSTGAWNEHR